MRTRAWLATNKMLLILGVVAAVALVAMSLSILWRAHDQAQIRQQVEQNTATAKALCDAAAGARDFWIKVRATTILAQTDANLSSTAKLANEHFIAALTDVINAANGVAHRCD